MCKLCGNSTTEICCKECQKELETKFGVKCFNCGAYGFMEKSKENIDRLAKLLSWEFVHNLNLGGACILPMNMCPECVKGN